MPVPKEELGRIRSGLARTYGADIWEGEGKRILLIRVPRAEPDPVNDVEAAIEYLRPDHVQDISHCFLLADQGAAQVYVRPLQDLMGERVVFDRKMFALWRERLPHGLSHAAFQAPEDPRRAWRLAVRIPVATMQDMQEHHLEDLADGIGPQLDTPRFRQMTAVYLVADKDAARLEADLFFTEIREKWSEEERRRQAQLAIAAKAEEDRTRRQRERERLVSEMEKRLAATSTRGSVVRQDAVATAQGPRPEPLFEAETDIAPAPRAPAAETIDIPPRGTDPASYARPSGSRAPATDITGHAADTGPGHAMDIRSGADIPVGKHTRDIALNNALDEMETAITQPGGRIPGIDIDALAKGTDIPHMLEDPEFDFTGEQFAKDIATAETPEARDQAIEKEAYRHVARNHALNDRLSSLRDRVDQAIQVTPSQAPIRKPRRDESMSEIDRFLSAGIRPAARTAEVRTGRASAVRRDIPRGTRREADPIDRAIARTPQAALRARLIDAGFEVLEAPDIPGQHIDIAAERPRGDPQRLVARFAERLDVQTARELLKAARELDVDLVLCVTDMPEPEGKRLLVATKVKVLRPSEVRRLDV